MVLSLGTALKEKIQSFRSEFAGVHLSLPRFGGRLEGLVFEDNGGVSSTCGPVSDGRIKMELLLVLRVVAGGDDGSADTDGGIHR